MAVTHADRIVREARRTLTLNGGKPLREDGEGNNDGVLLREYLIGKTHPKTGKILGKRITGFVPGQAWCIWFAQGIIVRAYPAGETLPRQLRPAEGSATRLRIHAEKYAQDGTIWTPGKPRAVIEASEAGISTGALGLVTDVTGDEFHGGICLGLGPHPAIPEWRLPAIPKARKGFAWMVEGNTNANGSAHGYTVCLHERNVERLRLIVF